MNKELTLEDLLKALINYTQNNNISYFGSSFDYKEKAKEETKKYLDYTEILFKACDTYLSKSFVPYVRLSKNLFPKICIEYNNKNYFIEHSFFNSKDIYSFGNYKKSFDSSKDVSKLLRLSINGNEISTSYVDDKIASDSEKYLQTKKVSINEITSNKINNLKNAVVFLCEQGFSEEDITRIVKDTIAKKTKNPTKKWTYYLWN